MIEHIIYNQKSGFGVHLVLEKLKDAERMSQLPTAACQVRPHSRHSFHPSKVEAVQFLSADSVG